MTVGDVFALIGLSLLGLVFWTIFLGAQANAEKTRKTLGGRKSTWNRALETVIAIVAAAMVVAPYLLMLMSIEGRVL